MVPGDRNHSRSEDDGHDAAHVQLQGQIAVLPAHLLAAHHALGVLDGDAALCVGHDDDEHNGHQCQNDQQRQEEVVLGLAGRCRVSRPVTEVYSEDQLDTIEAKISRETPLPMPLSSICSPHQVIS